jgi:hypothetical protein
MCVCVCVCVCVCTYTHVYIYMYTMYICAYVYMYIYAQCMYVYICTYIYILCVCIYIHTHTYTHTHIYSSFYIERSLETRESSWWNQDHVLSEEGYKSHEKYLKDLRDGEQKLDTCESRQNCWQRWIRGGGNVSIVVNDCAAFAGGACYLQRLGNITGLEVGCRSASSQKSA